MKKHVIRINKTRFLTPIQSSHHPSFFLDTTDESNLPPLQLFQPLTISTLVLISLPLSIQKKKKKKTKLSEKRKK